MSNEYPACNCNRQPWQRHEDSCALTLVAKGRPPVEPVHRIGCICETCSATYERERHDPRDGAR